MIWKFIWTSGLHWNEQEVVGDKGLLLASMYVASSLWLSCQYNIAMLHAIT